MMKAQSIPLPDDKEETEMNGEREREKSVKLTFRVAGDSGLLLIMFTLVCAATQRRRHDTLK